MLDLLFSPLTIRGKVIKNRMVVPPMLMNYCQEDGTCTERYAAYMEEKAKGGFGLILTENVAITSVRKATSGSQVCGRTHTSPASGI